jgi:thioredoxin-like negative regulator of GroEL
METVQLILPHELDDASVLARVQHVEEPVVVETRFDGWERPWRALAPGHWDELAREFGERVRLETLDTGRNRAFARRHGAEIVPQVLVFLRGEVVARFHGRVPVTELVRTVREVLRRDRAIAEASLELDGAMPPPRVARQRSTARASSRGACERRG